MATIETNMRFLARDELYNHEKPYELVYRAEEGVTQTNIVLEDTNVEIHDIRQRDEPPRLDREGFEVLRLHSKMDHSSFSDRETVRSLFAEELRAMLLQALGAKGIYFHETIIRRRHRDFPNIAAADYTGFEQPIQSAHIDITSDQLSALIEDLTGQEHKNARVQALNVWKPLRGPVQDWPLACCDARTVADSDLVTCDSVYPDGAIEGYQVHFNSNQKWWFLSNQDPSEVLIFNGVATSAAGPVPHCAFQLPQQSDMELRESIEFRVLAVY